MVIEKFQLLFVCFSSCPVYFKKKYKKNYKTFKHKVGKKTFIIVNLKLSKAWKHLK